MPEQGGTLTLASWNCRSGEFSERAQRLRQSARTAPDLVFLQECRPSPVEGGLIRAVNRSKAVALGSMAPDLRVDAISLPARRGGSIVATVGGRASFTILGLWAQGPDYGGDVLRTLRRHRRLLSAGPVVVMGDLNSGAKLAPVATLSRRHREVVDAFEALDLVSAYHAHHRVEHGGEAHATYYHQFRADQPWHIDFCFVPRAWLPRVRSATIGEATALTCSDHRPVIVELALTALEPSKT